MKIDPIRLRGNRPPEEPPYEMQNRGMPPPGKMVLDPIVLNGTPPQEPPDNLGVYPMAPPPQASAAREVAPAPEAPQAPPSSMSIFQDPAFMSFVQRRATDLANAQQDAAGRQKWANLANGFQRARAWGNSVAPDQGSIDQKNAYANLPVQQAKERAAGESGAIKDVDASAQAAERGIKATQLQASLDPNSPLSRNSLLLARAQGMVPAGYNGPFSASMLQEMEKGATLEVARKHYEAQVGIAGAQLAEHHAANQETARHHKVEEQFMYQKPLPPQSVTELESLLEGVKALDDLKGARDTSGVVDKALSFIGMGDYANTKTAAAGQIAKADAKGRVNPTGAMREAQILPGALTPGGDKQIGDRRRHMLDAAEQRLNVLAAGGARPAEVAEYRAQLDALKGGSASGGGPVKISGDADYAALPKGAKYIAPDGSTRTKR